MATLYIVATPIGNLGDMTPRATQVLASVGLVVCEDTRVSRKLLPTPAPRLLAMKSYASESVCAKVTAALSEGIDVAIVSDAGTPGIADPGAEIVRVVRHQCPAVPIVPVAGASAIAAAISVSGFPADQYYFAGFPPHKKGRQTFFAEIALRPEMVVMFESPHRIDKALESIAHSVPEREICLCRELTKRFESIHWGVADYHRERIRADAHNAKGEFVVILAPVSR